MCVQVVLYLCIASAASLAVQGRATLLLDLGCFSLSSATPDSQGLAADGEEAGLYECFTLGLERLEAGLVGGAFAWPSTQPPQDEDGDDGASGDGGLASGMTAAAMTRWGPAARAVQTGGAASDALFGPIPQKPSAAAAAAAAAAQTASREQPQGLAMVAGMTANEEQEAAADDSAAGAGRTESPQPRKTASRASSACGSSHGGGTEEEGEEGGAAVPGVADMGHHGGLADLLRQLALHRAAAAALQGKGSAAAGASDEPPPELVPLLSRFGVIAALQVATAPHPRLPAVRTRLEASPLVFRFSPWRFHRLMAVINSLVASLSSGSSGGGTGGGAADGAAGCKEALQVRLPLWVTDAEYTAPVQLLVWEGVGGRVAKWQPRQLVVWRGRVYLSRSPGSGVVSESRSYWRGWRLVELPPEEVGGAECAVAMVPEGVRREAAAEAPEGLVLRLSEARQVAELRRNMMRSAALVEAVAGEWAGAETAGGCKAASCAGHNPGLRGACTPACTAACLHWFARCRLQF